MQLSPRKLLGLAEPIFSQARSPPLQPPGSTWRWGGAGSFQLEPPGLPRLSIVNIHLLCSWDFKFLLCLSKGVKFVLAMILSLSFYVLTWSITIIENLSCLHFLEVRMVNQIVISQKVRDQICKVAVFSEHLINPLLLGPLSFVSYIADLQCCVSFQYTS